MRVDATLNGAALSALVPEAYILRVQRPLVGARRHVVVDVPGRAGGWLFPEQPGDRVIDVEVHVLGDNDSDRRNAVNRVADWADIGAVSKLVLSDEDDRFHRAILDTAPTFDERLRGAVGSLSFRVGPYSEAHAATVEAFVASNVLTFSTFAADVPVPVPPVIQITPVDGTLESFTFGLNGDELSYGTPVTEGATITVSSLSSTVTTGVSTDVDLTGAYDPENVVMADVSGTFPAIVDGSNSWSFDWDGSATDVSISITWRKRFR